MKVRLVPNGEYMIDERRFGLTYHAYVKEGEMDPAVLHEREHKRLRYLASKLVNDLEDAAKIYVFKNEDMTNPTRPPCMPRSGDTPNETFCSGSGSPARARCRAAPDGCATA